MKEETESKINTNSTEESQFLPPQRNVFSLISVICGLIGLFILPIFLGPIAIISGFYAYYQIKRTSNQRGRELAIIGIFLGFLDIISLLAFVYTIS